MAADSEARPRALVTGGAGFIGSHLVDRLLGDGYNVACVDNFALGRREHLESALLHPEFALHDFDLLDTERLSDVFAHGRFEIVFHLAANSDIRAGLESTDRDLNLTFLTTFSVLECMRRHEVRKLLFTSTGAIFGQHDAALREDAAMRPESLYGASKLASEAYITAFAGLYDIQAWVLRLANIVGPRATHGVIHDLLLKLDANPAELVVLGDGTQTKPYMFVDDLLDTFMFVLAHADSRVNVFNVGPRDGASVADIARAVLDAAGANQNIAYTGGARGWQGDVPLYRYEPAKLEALGWKSPASSREAVRKAAAAIVEERRGNAGATPPFTIIRNSE